MSKIKIDVSTLSGWGDVTEGEHSVTLKAKSAGFAPSDASPAVNVTKEPEDFYTFYLSDGKTKITDITVAGLENAYYYKKKGEPLKKRVGGRIFFINSTAVEGTDDKFYVYDTEFNPDNTYSWATTLTSIPGALTDKVGSGKPNTANIIAKNYGGTAWDYISGLNSASHQDCNDWFVGSKAEYYNLAYSTTPGAAWFAKDGGYQIWSSVEYYNHSTYACYWYNAGWTWSNSMKDALKRVVPIRSF